MWRKDSSGPKINVTLKAMSLLSEADSGEADNGSSRAKLLQEVVIMRQFRHPNIPRLYGVVDEDRVSLQGPIKWGRARGGLGVGRGEAIFCLRFNVHT